MDIQLRSLINVYIRPQSQALLQYQRTVYIVSRIARIGYDTGPCFDVRYTLYIYRHLTLAGNFIRRITHLYITILWKPLEMLKFWCIIFDNFTKWVLKHIQPAVLAKVHLYRDGDGDHGDRRRSLRTSPPVALLSLSMQPLALDGLVHRARWKER